MNKLANTRINPGKLLLSKWTAVQPQHKEKHFLVTRIIRDEQEIITACVLEAVMGHNEYELEWRELKNTSHWLQGWL
ncbi:MAG: TIGR02450 family Trp-rich protein [Methylococcaceae bacterium]